MFLFDSKMAPVASSVEDKPNTGSESKSPTQFIQSESSSRYLFLSYFLTLVPSNPTA